MFKNIHNNSFLNKMKKICNACVKPTKLNYGLKLFILIKKSLLSRVFNVLFSDKKYSSNLIMPLDNISEISHI